MKATGALPPVFEGDQSKAEEFMEDLRSYLRLNARVPPLNTYQGKVNFSLTLIKGKQVRDFVREQGDIVDTSIEALDTWLDFLNAFDAHFLDTQIDTRARMEIENLKMKDNNIDKYVQHFRALAQEANYNLREVSVLMKFLKGLPRGVTVECIKAP
jgi:DNA mismatch repair ATPase MutS